MSDTNNAAEYFCCIRAWLGHRQQDMAALLDCDQVTISDFERGRLLPPTAVMERIRPLFPLNGHEFQEYESLVIANRVYAARAYAYNGKAESASLVLNELPRVYWWETIARANDEQA